ncbi:MAG: hypothetical protein IKP40_11585 [Clostridia bacterium]|nr:hypothetical protein [Clostridia bacterium]
MNKVKSALRAIGKGLAFVAVFLVLGGLIMNVMVFKQEDGTLPVHNYYTLPRDTVDVLILGTSHAGMNVSTKTMWDEYGIAGYRFWGSIQPIWNTYYYLLEALKYQTPKVVVMDAHSLTFQQEYGTYPVQVKNTIAMRLSREKVENVLASVPAGDRAFMLFGFPTYHNRYSELTEDDFLYFPWNSHQEIQVLSSETTDYIYAFDIMAPDATEGEAELGEKEEKYFRMLLSYCAEHGIPLEIVASPYELTAIEQQKFRRVRSIAAEYGVSFTNYNDCYQDYGIDTRQDFLDPGHFNKTGMPKYARALAEMLKSKYDLPDRRQDAGHIWNQTRVQAEGPVYALTEQQRLDGLQDAYDTGIRLYENPLSSWTLCTAFTLPDPGSESCTALSCYDAEAQTGLVVSREANGTLIIRYTGDMTVRVQEPPELLQLCIIKMGQTIKIYLNGELLEEKKLDMSDLPRHSGTLLLGCEVSASGRKLHYGKTTVRDLVIYDTALSEPDVQAWTPRELPLAERTEYLRAVTEDDLILSLQNRFVGDGETYVDTGKKLYADAESSFTLLSRLELSAEGGDTVYFSCFSEEPGAYRGLLVRKVGEKTLNIVYGDGSGLSLDVADQGSAVLAIVKDRSAYTVYLDGSKVLDQDVRSCLPYDGTFLIGSQTDQNGDIFRVSQTTLYNLDVYSGVMTEEQILKWMPEPLPEAERDPGMDVTYRLPIGFTGNKKDACVDTGLQLYDNPAKDWTLSFVLDRVTVRRGCAVSCFDETPGKYRGLLVRQMDATHFSVVTGTEYTEIEIHPADRLTMTIVKRQHAYSIYVDGVLTAEKESRIASYLGPMMIGCERSQIGMPFRFSDASVRRLRVMNEALTDEQVLAMYQAWEEEWP